MLSPGRPRQHCARAGNFAAAACRFQKNDLARAALTAPNEAGMILDASTGGWFRTRITKVTIKQSVDQRAR
jgi:hypothetical protein